MPPQIKEHPIIFSSESVKAILNGSKTQSRRVIKPRPIKQPIYRTVGGRPELEYWYEPDSEGNIAHIIKCPYGQVGDRLWVRETWHSIESPTEKDSEFVTYKATAHPHILKTIKWKPSIFMPRWASRITLEITEVRVERLQEITEEDAKAEGCTIMAGTTAGGNMGLASARYSFMKLWDSLNAKRGQWRRWEDDEGKIHREFVKVDYSWQVNPWVWVISFKGLDKSQ